MWPIREVALKKTGIADVRVYVTCSIIPLAQEYGAMLSVASYR